MTRQSGASGWETYTKLLRKGLSGGLDLPLVTRDTRNPEAAELDMGEELSSLENRSLLLLI